MSGKKWDLHRMVFIQDFWEDARQVDLILKFVDMLCTEGTHILVDPVMGDRGETYKTYSETLCEKMRELWSEKLQ